MKPLAALALFASLLAAPAASALTCTASMTDINFGAISVRSGVTNSTTGNISVECTDPVATVAGVCVSFGPGSGGAGAGNSPRYLRRADNAALNYELRATGSGPAHGTWNSVYLTVPVLPLPGSGTVNLPVYADITSSGVGVSTGLYSSIFSGPSNVRVDYGVLSCGVVEQTAVPLAFTISANVQSSCEVDSTALDFGAVPQAIGAPIDAQATLNVRCTAATDYSIRLDLGTGSGATGPEDRRMTFGAGTLRYGLYQDSGRTMPWGNLPTNDVESQGLGTNQAFSIFGRLHGGQTAPPGLYRDTVLAIIEY